MNITFTPVVIINNVKDHHNSILKLFIFIIELFNIPEVSNLYKPNFILDAYGNSEDNGCTDALCVSQTYRLDN